MARQIIGKTGAWDICVGLEIHAQIQLATKLFSRALAGGDAGAPNECVSAFDMSSPGTLPVVNEHAVFQAARTGFALDGQVHRESVFERKHYFYFDLPLGYQITQQRAPIVTDAVLDVELEPEGPEDPSSRRVRICRIQLEQDSGKSVHDLVRDTTLVNLNRAGSALMELVTEPDLRSAVEAAAFVRQLALLLRHIGVCEGNMSQGQLRCDVNVSVRPEGQDAFGERVEVKNLNSIRSVARAVEHEAARQVAQIEAGDGPIARDTRSFNAATGVTERRRAKEAARDYRFFPDPDLPPLIVDDTTLLRARESVPELPTALRARLVSAHGVTPYQAAVLVGEVGATRLFEQTAAAAKVASPARVANWVVNELFGALRDRAEATTEDVFTDCPVSPEQVAGLADLVESERLSSKMGKEVLLAMVAGKEGGDPHRIVAGSHRYTVQRDSDELSRLCDEAIVSPNGAKAAKKFLGGDERSIGPLVGVVIKATKGTADPKLTTALMRQKLDDIRRAGGEEDKE